MLLIVMAAALALGAAWYALCRWRKRLHREIAALPRNEKSVELHLSLDTDTLKLAGGAAVVVGLALTAIQILQDRTASDRAFVTERLEKAYTRLAQTSDAERVAGVLALPGLDAIDPDGRRERYVTLMVFLRSWSPYRSRRTDRCLVDSTPTGMWPADVTDEPSTLPTDPTRWAVRVLSNAGTGRLIERIDLHALNLRPTSERSTSPTPTCHARISPARSWPAYRWPRRISSARISSVPTSAAPRWPAQT
jgi:hypothetical protein